ncbi:MAG: 16S rRNA (cytidine(1402)-2'-O)-methyltransferase [Clostridiales bacterium]|jgi:16S rRNA (cytidine1402-2'-O)-methyltransferase|nr:16S rRNA (cytidine(1402)-2'-O)-methyltransferase [Clostridiales bacterium]
MDGKLYIVGTPIGNLEDITFRAVETLKSVDLIAAEDTRHTQKLLNHFQIKVPLVSYYEHKKREKGEFVLKKLQEGKNVALVSDAGMPGISDPGEDLVRLCAAHGVAVTVIPGPTAFTAALVLSGLSASRFCFEGFLTVKKTGKLARLEQIKTDERTLIFYEAPHKLLRTLDDIYKVLGDRKAAACRELTKKFEEVIRGTVAELLAHFSENAPRGEFVLVVEGAPHDAEPPDFEQSVSEQIDSLIKNGTDKKTAIQTVAQQRGLPKRAVYNEYEGGK